MGGERGRWMGVGGVGWRERRWVEGGMGEWGGDIVSRGVGAGRGGVWVRWGWPRRALPGVGRGGAVGG